MLLASNNLYCMYLRNVLRWLAQEVEVIDCFHGHNWSMIEHLELLLFLRSDCSDFGQLLNVFADSKEMWASNKLSWYFQTQPCHCKLMSGNFRIFTEMASSFDEYELISSLAASEGLASISSSLQVIVLTLKFDKQGATSEFKSAGLFGKVAELRKMLPLARFRPMGTVHGAAKTPLMNRSVMLAPTKLPCSVENTVWPQLGLKDSIFRKEPPVEEDSLCEELNISRKLPVSLTLPIVKAGTRKECPRTCISSVQQECLSNKFSCDDSEFESALLPGLSDDVAKYCLALVPRSDFQSLGLVSKRWRSFVQSKEFYTVRKHAGTLEEWLYVLTADPNGERSQWQVLDSVNEKWELLPPMPGPLKTAFGFVVIDGKLLVMGGLVEDGSVDVASADVYKYDPTLNCWSLLAKMNVARREFACAVVDGLVYAVGGHGVGGENLSSVEVFDPQRNEWTLIESLRRPRWGCFACGLEGKLYVMGGRSSFTIGNSKYIDIYNPENHTWGESKNGCVMVVAHAVLYQSLFCIEWKNERQLAVFNSSKNSWKRVPVPLTGSRTVAFCFGRLDGKLLLFPTKMEPFCQTLVYDPNAMSGSEWQVTSIRPPGTCLCSVTISA
eukprot:Gb_29211 [translate_table: standard]